ncbi:MAG: hypothetical protein ACR2OT_05505, partial [Parvibaculales bacterium]
IEFDLGKITLSITEGGVHRLVLTPVVALGVDTTMRWHIVSEDGLITLTGTLDFDALSIAPQILIVTPTGTQSLGAFEFRLYEIEQGQDDVLLGEVIMPQPDKSEPILHLPSFNPSAATVHGLVFSLKDGVHDVGTNLQHILFGTIGSFTDTALIDTSAQTLRIHLNPAYYSGSYDAFVNHLASVIGAGPLYFDFEVSLAGGTDGVAPVLITPAHVDPVGGFSVSVTDSFRLVSAEDLIAAPQADAPDVASTGSAGSAGSVSETFDLHLADAAIANVEQFSVSINGDDGAKSQQAALSVDVSEGTQAVTTIIAANAEAGEAVSYALSGEDAALFDIDDSGALRFKSAATAQPPSTSDNVYDVRVTVTDTDGISDRIDLMIIVDVL